MRFFLLCVCIWSVASCGDTKEKSDASDSVTELEGTWENSCSKEANGMFGGHTLHRNVFTGSSCRLETEDFSGGDSTCNRKNLIATTIGHCTFILDGNEIDSTRTKVEIIPNIDGLSSSTLDGVCPKLSFTKNVATDVSSCGFYPTPLSIFDIFDVEGDQLYFGQQTDDLDGTSKKKRPAAIDRTDAFRKSTL